MKKQNKLNTVFLIVIAAALALACSGANQQAEANKIVDEANKKLDQTKDDYSKIEIRNSFLFSANIQTIQQLRYYQSKMSDEAQSISREYERISTSLKDIGKQYDDISRLNVDEKYKSYAKLKSDEYVKRSEAVSVRKGNAQAFAEISDPRIMTSKFAENNDKSDKLFKEAEDTATKAKKIEEDNKEIFAKS